MMCLLNLTGVQLVLLHFSNFLQINVAMFEMYVCFMSRCLLNYQVRLGRVYLFVLNVLCAVCLLLSIIQDILQQRYIITFSSVFQRIYKKLLQRIGKAYTVVQTIQ